MKPARELLQLEPGIYLISKHESGKVGILPITEKELNKLIEILGGFE